MAPYLERAQINAAFCRHRNVESFRIQVMPCFQPITCSNNTQTQLRPPPRRRPTAQSLAPCRLSRDKLRLFDLSLFSFTLYGCNFNS